MKAYTDYPDSEKFAGQRRPMREITVLDYDNDKYVTIKEYPYSIKSGYVYRTRRKVPFMNKTLNRRFPE